MAWLKGFLAGLLGKGEGDNPYDALRATDDVLAEGGRQRHGVTLR